MFADFTESDSNIRVYKEFTLDRKDPYGFWFVRKTEGKTPKELQDESFTSTDQALRAIEVYIKNQKPILTKKV